MNIPDKTVDLITYLESIHKDEMETNPEKVGTPDYWKKAGVLELIKTLKYSIENTLEKPTSKSTIRRR